MNFIKDFFKKIKLNRLVKKGKRFIKKGIITDKVSAYIFLLSSVKDIGREDLFSCSRRIFDEE